MFFEQFEGGSVQHRVVQDRETVMIQESCVSALLYEVDDCSNVAMEHCPVQTSVARLSVLAVELTVSRPDQPLQH